jgi:hypothetical protein
MYNGVAIVRKVGSGNAQLQVQGAFVALSRSNIEDMSGTELKYYIMYKGAGGRGQTIPDWWPAEYHQKLTALKDGGAHTSKDSSK